LISKAAHQLKRSMLLTEKKSLKSLLTSKKDITTKDKLEKELIFVKEEDYISEMTIFMKVNGKMATRM
jgi:hypothetical protein